MWNAIAYVGSGLTLVAFVVLVIFYFDNQKRKLKLKSIESLPKGRRESAVDVLIRDLPFPMDLSELSEENQFKVIRMQLRARLIKLIIICLCLTLVSAYSIYKVNFKNIKPPGIIIKDRVNLLKRKILGNELRSSWESRAFVTSRHVQKKVLHNGVSLAQQLEEVDRDNEHILPLNRIDREQYMGYAYLMAAEAAYYLEKTQVQIDLLKKSIFRLNKARRVINNFKENIDYSDEESLKYLQAINEDVDLYRITLLESMCLSLAHCTLAKKDQMKIADFDLSHIKSKIDSIPERILVDNLEMDVQSERWLSKTMKEINDK